MMNELSTRFRSLINDGMPQDDVIGVMRVKGLSIIGAIKLTRELYGVDLGEAKQLVAAHPSYSSRAAAAVPFHEELRKLATKWSEEESEG